jgi:hypothetical protein
LSVGLHHIHKFERKTARVYVVAGQESIRIGAVRLRKTRCLGFATQASAEVPKQ